MKWAKNAKGEPRPVYTDAEAHRIAAAAWEIQGLVGHPDEQFPEDAPLVREFNRAIAGVKP